jgi:hypothetical protein
MAIASANAHDAHDAALRNSRGDFDTLKTQFKNVQKIRIGPSSYLSFMAKTSKLAAELSPKKAPHRTMVQTCRILPSHHHYNLYHPWLLRDTVMAFFNAYYEVLKFLRHFYSVFV